MSVYYVCIYIHMYTCIHIYMLDTQTNRFEQKRTKHTHPTPTETPTTTHTYAQPTPHIYLPPHTKPHQNPTKHTPKNTHNPNPTPPIHQTHKHTARQHQSTVAKANYSGLKLRIGHSKILFNSIFNSNSRAFTRFIYKWRNIIWNDKGVYRHYQLFSSLCHSVYTVYS
jgi:hypothetical protein